MRDYLFVFAATNGGYQQGRDPATPRHKPTPRKVSWRRAL